ncbi:MAG: amino acid permease [Candidatus Nanopelagicales bacterium]|jgi:amino acid transporter|nr:amino acid permease [Candidatus Nanopelagicales bacterium]
MSGTLKREFTLWSTFAFAFAFISPIVAIYGIFGLAYTTAGPGFWWNFLLVFGGQLLVAMIFAELVSKWPVEGSIYQWTRRLTGKGAGWFAGWFYMWTLVVAMATVAMGAASFVANVIGLTITPAMQAVIAIIILVLGTLANLQGRGVIKILMTGSIIAEIVGSVGLGIWLLLFHTEQPLSSITTGLDTVVGSGFTNSSFLIAMAFVGWAFVGFESAGSIAEEVKDPQRTLPKVVLFSLTFVASVVAFAALAVILAIPDPAKVMSGETGDPVFSTLVYALGEGPAKVAQVLFAIGFLASFLALQTSASRVIWSYARDKALPLEKSLSALRGKSAIPANAVIVASVVGAIMIGASQLAPNFYALMVNFTTGGFYISFLFPVAGFVVVLFSNKWKSGPFTFGAKMKVISIFALIWTVFQFLNISWPRPVYTETPLLDWSVAIGIGGLTIIGALIYASVNKRMTMVDADALNRNS